MTIPIDYNKMQKQLDKRHYMGQIYTGKYETWQATELGLKTYGKWCDLIGWVNLTEQKWTSTADFMNLAIKRNWAEVVYDFKIKSKFLICPLKPTIKTNSDETSTSPFLG